MAKLNYYIINAVSFPTIKSPSVLLIATIKLGSVVCVIVYASTYVLFVLASVYKLNLKNEKCSMVSFFKNVAIY